MIVFLGPLSPAYDIISDNGGVVRYEYPVDISLLSDMDPEWILSYGYRYIIKKNVVEKFRHHIINCHISYLPWGRGADPNYWAWKNGEPHGVTIHEIDEGIDTGPIIAQEIVRMSLRHDDTLRSSYDRLQKALTELLKNQWPHITSGSVVSKPQVMGGSYHKSSERPELPRGWDTPVREL